MRKRSANVAAATDVYYAKAKRQRQQHDASQLVVIAWIR
ncbi:hypothetical protein LSPCS325_37990 [Lysinibacillus sp. CTST325]